MHLLHLLCSLPLLTTVSATADVLLAAGETVPNQYVVKMTSGMARPAFDTAMTLVTHALGQNDRILHQYFFSDFRGFSINAPMAVITAISDIPGVEFIEPDHVSHLEQRVLQQDSTYGLDRISHRRNHIAAGRNPPSFLYYRPTGYGTTIYVVDSGIYIEHDDFTGRARRGAVYAPPNVKGNPNDDRDYTGHGTHVASVAAGNDYGVAKNASIVDVKTFNDAGESSASYEVAGIEFATNDAEQNDRATMSVINMSFSGPSNPDRSIVGEAVRAATRAGILCVAAAGNAAINADDVNPANIEQACTVGAIDETDNQADFSNYGQSVDLWAPGVRVRGAFPAMPTRTVLRNGTSQAAPYVAGVAAYLKAGVPRYREYDPVEFCRQMGQDGTKNMIKFQSFAQPPGPNVIVFDLGNDDQ